MKTKTLGIITSLILLLCFACEKDKICLENDVCSSNEYMPLAIGNYWVYETQIYNFNTYSISTFLYPDTIKVIGDTTFRNNQYFTLSIDKWGANGFQQDTTFLRDSVGYLVNQHGVIQFATADFDRNLHRETISIGDFGERYVDYSIRDSNIVNITPSGVYNCLDYSGQVWTGLVWHEHQFHNCYAKGVGLVYQSKFFNISNSNGEAFNPTNELRRLLTEYHLE